MRRTPLTIGILAAELAVGALAAPPALADDPERPPEPTVEPVDLPLPAVVRSGRALDLPELPDVLPELPIAVPDAPAEPPPVEPAPAAPVPAPQPAAPAPQSEQPAPAVPAPVSPPVPAAAAPPASHTVVAGDSLWGIAASQVANAGGRDRATLGPVDIVGYWVRMCEANRERLRSRDLDLIFAGEVVVLPPL